MMEFSFDKNKLKILGGLSVSSRTERERERRRPIRDFNDEYF